MNTSAEKTGQIADQTKEQEKHKFHDYKGDVQAIADEVKNLKKNWRDYDLREAWRDIFSAAKQDFGSLWKKPETLLPGRKFAGAGLVLSILSLLLLATTSGTILGILIFAMSLAALSYEIVGLRTEGRSVAVVGSITAVVAVICSFGQIFGEGTSPEQSARQFVNACVRCDYKKAVKMAETEDSDMFDSFKMLDFLSKVTTQNIDDKCDKFEEEFDDDFELYFPLRGTRQVTPKLKFKEGKKTETKTDGTRYMGVDLDCELISPDGSSDNVPIFMLKKGKGAWKVCSPGLTCARIRHIVDEME